MRPAAQPSSLDSCLNTSSRLPEGQEYCCEWELHQLDLLFGGVLHFQGNQLLSFSGSCDIAAGYGQLWWLTVMVSSAQAFGNLGLDMIIIWKEKKKSSLFLTDWAQEQSWEALKDGNVWHQAGWGPDQPGQVEDVPGSCPWQGVAMRWSSSPFQHKPSFHYSISYTLQSPWAGTGIETRKGRWFSKIQISGAESVKFLSSARSGKVRIRSL